MQLPDALTKSVTIAVFGATGQTGHHVVRHALGDGHRVRAQARDPGRMEVLVASLAPTFADLGAFTVRAVQDASLHGTHPFVAPKGKT